MEQFEIISQLSLCVFLKIATQDAPEMDKEGGAVNHGRTIVDGIKIHYVEARKDHRDFFFMDLPDLVRAAIANYGSVRDPT
jgi:hypothetical protein